jgi:hypothetical protein
MAKTLADGRIQVESGDTLSGIYGANWKTLSGYSGDPTKLQIGTILPAIKSSAPVVEKTPATVEDANKIVNADQTKDFNNATKTEEPAIRSSVDTYNTIYKQISESLTKDLGTKPEAVDLTETYKSLRSDSGITTLESSLADLQAQARDLQAASAARTSAEKAKPVAMNVIAGRISEEEAQDNERLTAINNSIKTVTDQLTTKYNMIDTIMKYTGEDYDNAVKNYDTKLSQNLSIMNTVKGMADTIKTDSEQAGDDARANLQIIYNNLNSGGVDVSTLDPATKLNITKLELQAGLPQGFYTSITNKNPKADILSTTTREDNGKKYADVLLKNADGSLTVTTKYLGGVDLNAGTKPTETEKKSQTFALINKLLTMKDPDGEPYTDSDGFLTPKGFKTLVVNAAEDGIDRTTFLSQYGSYIDPANLDAYGLTMKEKASLSY